MATKNNVRNKDNGKKRKNGNGKSASGKLGNGKIRQEK